MAFGAMNLFNKLLDLELDALRFGFRWESAMQILQQVESECVEVKEVLQQEQAKDETLQYELGDLLHAVLSLCVFCGFDPELTLEKSLNKFEQRFLAVKQLAKNKGLKEVQHLSTEQLMELWGKAKILTEENK